MKTVAITGASGFLGSALARALRADGVRVLRIGRGPAADISWEPNASRLDAAQLRGVDAVVHLAGENIAQRWTDRAKRDIRESRVKGTALIARALAHLPDKPVVLVSASAVGVYGAHRGDEILKEASSLGTDFLGRVAQEWESAAQPARNAGIRVVHNRTGVVLHPAAGMLQRLVPLFSLGAGGRIGSGRQWLPWIARTDWIRAIRFLLDAKVEGPFNVSAPNPVTNADFTKTLGRVLKRPTLFTVPESAVTLAFGEMGKDTVLASQRMLPDRLLAAGFSFGFPDLEQALRHELKDR
ncbi:MAG: TIGR01777 family oxidoreductase [Gemmatimonadaceae bacterium]